MKLNHKREDRELNMGTDEMKKIRGASAKCVLIVGVVLALIGTAFCGFQSLVDYYEMYGTVDGSTSNVLDGASVGFRNGAILGALFGGVFAGLKYGKLEQAFKKAGNGTSAIKGFELVFGDSPRSVQKFLNQMTGKGWTVDLVRNTVERPYMVRNRINRATGNPATIFYMRNMSYVIVDDVTKMIVQLSDNKNPTAWIPDLSIAGTQIPR